MEKIIEETRDLGHAIVANATNGMEDVAERAARRLEECRALLERLANDEPAPEGHTFQSWARGLLA